MWEDVHIIQLKSCLPALTELIPRQWDRTASQMCQTLGFEIRYMLYKLVSFILYCTHVELPPLDFNIQIYVRIMHMMLPWISESPKVSAALHTKRFASSFSSGKAQGTSLRPPFHSEALWGWGRWAQSAQQTCLTWWMCFPVSPSWAKTPEGERETLAAKYLTF